MISIQELQRKLKECSGHLKDDSEVFREILGTQRNLWEGFSKVSEALMKPQSQSKSSQVEETWTCAKKPRKCSVFLKDDFNDFGKIPDTQRNLWEGFPKVSKALAKPQSHSKSSQADLEHCLLVIVTKFKLSKATSARPFMAFALNPEVSIFLCDIPNEYNECLHTSLYLLCIFRESGNKVIQ
jgi:hypothetical protein